MAIQHRIVFFQKPIIKPRRKINTRLKTGTTQNNSKIKRFNKVGVKHIKNNITRSQNNSKIKRFNKVGVKHIKKIKIYKTSLRPLLHYFAASTSSKKQQVKTYKRRIRLIKKNLKFIKAAQKRRKKKIVLRPRFLNFASHLKTRIKRRKKKSGKAVVIKKIITPYFIIERNIKLRLKRNIKLEIPQHIKKEHRACRRKPDKKVIIQPGEVFKPWIEPAIWKTMSSAQKNTHRKKMEIYQAERASNSKTSNPK